MKIIVRAQLVTDWGEVTEVDVATFSRPAFGLNADTLGLSLADGKRLLQQLQQAISGAQADELCNLHRVCQCWPQGKIGVKIGLSRLRRSRA
jgi:hypothetical protein